MTNLKFKSLTLEKWQIISKENLLKLFSFFIPKIKVSPIECSPSRLLIYHVFLKLCGLQWEDKKSDNKWIFPKIHRDATIELEFMPVWIQFQIWLPSLPVPTQLPGASAVTTSELTAAKGLQQTSRELSWSGGSCKCLSKKTGSLPSSKPVEGSASSRRNKQRGSDFSVFIWGSLSFTHDWITARVKHRIAEGLKWGTLARRPFYWSKII